MILDELIAGGEIEETSKPVVLRRVSDVEFAIEGKRPEIPSLIDV